MTAFPPRPIWSCEHLAVYVNGGFVEFSGYDPDFMRLTPAEAVEFAADLQAAVAEAGSWAARWNPVTRAYNEVPA